MFHFHTPWFALLLPLPFLLRFFWPSKKSKSEIPELLFPGLERLKESFSNQVGFSGKKRSLVLPLLSLIWVLLVLALMQPEKVDQYQTVKNKGYDLMLAVDTSGSMQALDFSTTTKTVSRLDVTKEVVGKFVRGRLGDRVGLITFGEHAYLHVPLTLDTLSVGKMLDDTVVGMAGQSTAIGDAIGLSIKTLRERPPGSRVLILLTDGEDNSSALPPLEAAKLAKQYGIKIYTIGVGKGGAVPFPTQFGGVTMAEVPIDENLLKEIAAITEGSYFQASDKKALESIYAKINALEKSEYDQSIFLVREPFYAYPLGFAIALLLLLTLFEIIPFSTGRRLHGA